MGCAFNAVAVVNKAIVGFVSTVVVTGVVIGSSVVGEVILDDFLVIDVGISVLEVISTVDDVDVMVLVVDVVFNTIFIVAVVDSVVSISICSLL